MSRVAVKPRLYRGVDRASRVSERRGRLVQAGISLFGTVGYSATTVKTVCGEAALTTRYFYESFERLEDLFIACYEQLMGEFRERLWAQLSAAPADLESKLRLAVKTYLEAMRDPLFARISYREMLGASEEVALLGLENISVSGGIITELFRTAGAMTDLSSEDQEVIGVALAGSLMHAAVHWVERGYMASLDSMVDNCVVVLLGAGIAAETSVSRLIRAG